MRPSLGFPAINDADKACRALRGTLSAVEPIVSEWWLLLPSVLAVLPSDFRKEQLKLKPGSDDRAPEGISLAEM